MLTDSHAHLTSSELYEGVGAVLERAWQADVRRIVNICTDVESLEKGIILAAKTPWIINAAATHPHDVAAKGEQEFERIREKAPYLKAIGETGLDYHYDHSPREMQRSFLERYLRLSQELQLPVIIHCREAFKDFFEIYDKVGPLPGVLHCFTGTAQEAQEVLKRNLYLSLSGIVTYKKSVELQAIAKTVPLERLLIETDAPFLAPRTHRGKTNEPAFLVETAQFIAELRNIPYPELARATTANTARLFKIRD